VDVGKYSLNLDETRLEHIDVLDTDLSIFAPASMDHVFVGAREHVPLRDLASKLKIGGHLILHSLGLEADKHRAALCELGSWKEKESMIRNEQYLGVWKLLRRSGKGTIEPGRPRATKRACIARYGAIGDMIILSPLIRTLHEDGYEVTLNVTPYCADVLKHNPYVSNIIIQERDVIPNQDLAMYWNEWIPEYDKYINLSESIEGSLLKVEGRRDFYTHKSWRNELCGDTNYIDNTMRLGGYPDRTGLRGELYFSATEQKQAKYFRSKFANNFVVMWAVKGSSYHKIYPLLEPFLDQWLSTHPDALVCLVGGKGEEPLQFSHPQVIPMVGQLALRDVFALTQYVDCVAGPETSILNAAGCFATPKLVMLSHSSHTNLCKYWENDYCLQANVGCSPCNQLHYSMESCPLTQILDPDQNPVWRGPTCSAVGFPPQVLAAQLDKIYSLWAANRTHTPKLL